jgi:transaldolase
VFQGPLIRRLGEAGVALNVTAILTLEQVDWVVEALAPETWAIVSVFAGRIADTGVDPIPLMAEAKRILRWRPRAQLLWASPREILNVFQAEDAGCDIITVAPEILRKMNLVGKDLAAYSLETVDMFHCDALGAAYQIDTSLVVAAKASEIGADAIAENDPRGIGQVPSEVIGTGVSALRGRPDA